MKSLNKILKDSKTVVFLDFEATEQTFEIISIGAIKAQLDNKNQIKSYDEGFKCYVYTDTPITPVIEEMTKITNKLLDEKGISFKEALDKLSNYIGKNLNFTHFFTFGGYDMRLLHATTSKYNLNENNLVLQIFSKNTDFSAFFNQYIKDPTNHTLSLINSLRLFHVRPVEPYHDPLSDAKNLMLLYDAFLKNPTVVRNEYLKVLMNNPNLRAPIKKVLEKLKKENFVSLDDFYTYINEDLK